MSKYYEYEDDDEQYARDEACDMADECDDEEEEYEWGICPSCSGSGEGMHESTRCSRCKGSGEI